MKKTIVLLGVLVSLILADTTFVDWASNSLRITVSSKTDLASSRSNISERLLSLLKNTYFDASQKVGDFLRYDFQKESQLIPYLQDYQRVDERYLTDGSQEIDYELSMSGRIISLLTPKSEAIKLVVPMLCPTCGQTWPQGKSIPEGVTLTPKEENIPFNYTSIVIDCRNLNLNPCLFPRVKTDRGDDVYSVNFCPADYLSENGLTLYLSDIQDIYSNSRIGYSPLRINAVGVGGRNRTDPIISQFDAVKIHGSKNGLDLLAKCRVVLIVGH